MILNYWYVLGITYMHFFHGKYVDEKKQEINGG
jgi:hypothetical protein